MADKKNFVIINTQFIGDSILTNSLVQNIKRIYDDANVIMVVAPYMAEIAKYLKGVDDVVVWDRFNKDRGFIPTLRFVHNFPYKHVYASFPIYGTDRPVVISRLLGSRYVLCGKQKFFSNFRNSKYPVILDAETAQEEALQLLSGITRERLADVPNVLELPDKKISIIDGLEDYTVIIPASTRLSKEIPVELITDIISSCKEKKFVLLGSGDLVSNYSKRLANYKFDNLIDLANKTTLLDAAYIIKKSNAVISSDTGLMHISCALNKPTVALFFEDFTKKFIPKQGIYNCISITENHNLENVLDCLKKVTEQKELIHV